MQTKNLKGNGKIVLVRTEISTEIYVSHMGEPLAFSLPIEEKGDYIEVMTQIRGERLSIPTTAQTFSLVNLALQNPDEEHCQDILNKFRRNYFWTSTENLYTPKEIIVYDNVDGTMPFDRESLLKRHKEGDKAVRVVPYGFKTKRQSVNELLKNPYVIAQVGSKDMLEVVKRVVEGVSKNKPLIWILNKPSKNVRKYNTRKYSALGSGWGLDAFGLGGFFDFSHSDGYAPRVRNMNDR